MHISQPLVAALPETRTNVRLPPSLLTIPGEIRNRIYDHLLLVGRVNVFNCSACDPHENIPDLAILRVNRQINEEASAFLYSTGTFVVSTGRDLAGFMSKTDDFCVYTAVTETFPSRAAIRSLEIRFVAEYNTTDFHEERMQELWHSAVFRGESRRRKAKHLHDLDRNASRAVWGVAGELLSMLHGLQNLTVNVEQAFCPDGCCRLVDAVARSLRRLRRKPELKVNVTGSLDDDEVKVVTDALTYREGSNATTESNSESNDAASEVESDSHSDDSRTNDSSDRIGDSSDASGNSSDANGNSSDANGNSSNDEGSNNSGQIEHIDDGIAGEQTIGGSG